MPRKKFSPMVQMSERIRDSFWSHVSKTDEHSCWPWTAARVFGYGKFGFRQDKKTFQFRANRVAYYLSTGTDPIGLEVCHSCDNPPCCNPAHLFLGTSADNVADKINKGRGLSGDKHPRAYLPPSRFPNGERHGMHKLTADQVREIRNLYDGDKKRSIPRLSMKFGVSEHQIERIVYRMAWKLV